MVGIVSKWWIADWPETAKFLTEEERRLLVTRLSYDTGEARMDHLDKRAAKQIATDWKIYAGTVAYFGVVNTGYAGSVSVASQTVSYSHSDAHANSSFSFPRSLKKWDLLLHLLKFEQYRYILWLQLLVFLLLTRPIV